MRRVILNSELHRQLMARGWRTVYQGGGIALLERPERGISVWPSQA